MTCNRKPIDLSAADKVLSFLYFLKGAITETFRYRKFFKNYLSVSYNLLRGKFPIRAELMDGKYVILHNRTYVNYLVYTSSNKSLVYDTENDLWSFPYSQNTASSSVIVKLHSGRGNGEIISIFLKGVYSQLPVKDRIIVDIGANIGDSSVYFALKGAERVISVEPFPMNYEIARKNIELNSMLDKIILLLGACTRNSGYATVDPTFQEIGACISSDSSNLDHNRVVKIPTWTLEHILEKYYIKSEAILKIDCEGCEYEVIFSATKEVLRRFSHIVIEYHYGYRGLKKKLENSGFNVYTTRPRAHHRDYLYEFIQERWMYVGYLYAENKTSEL